ncbi:hypothetical protein GCM10007147_42970 [Nocardiopsis kunsanensis]|uniref:Uncharacterized protein n=1 Tax=Nocardiopsis kunsanensis TaxID=141693 RepID=A0A918XK26_9ACTN|nr:hypothetical protein [Nocardiopsis kunsanensis]GHD36027.1 hypothetical protein GCM10007147_42970 [Nocardiopsis kunsanensis]
MNYDYEACGWWTFTLPGFRGEALCTVGHDHKGGHECTTSGSITLPTTATRTGDTCAAHDENGNGFLCDLEPGHQGACRNQNGPVFADADPAGTFADTPQEAGTLTPAEQGHLPTTDVDALVAVLTRVLSRRWDGREAATALNTADVCFGRLDRILRDGGELPARWSATGTFVSVTGMVLADVDYDSVSEELRTTGDAATCRQALRDAWSGWEALTASLEAGGPLPGPWDRP